MKTKQKKAIKVMVGFLVLFIVVSTVLFAVGFATKLKERVDEIDKAQGFLLTFSIAYVDDYNDQLATIEENTDRIYRIFKKIGMVTKVEVGKLYKYRYDDPLAVILIGVRGKDGKIGVISRKDIGSKPWDIMKGGIIYDHDEINPIDLWITKNRFPPLESEWRRTGDGTREMVPSPY